ncbi:glycoside hydrolase family protein [Aquabacterium sp.]|uniref:glycoside hydrolase family protein n=1 Tax=Aquabacterium sp. TaxID=1872578 RepID=UPI0035B2F0CB
MANLRTVVGSMTLSAAALIGLAVNEGYTETASIPTRNDRPTNGFGSTLKADGTPVKIGEKTDPVRALITLQAHVSKEEAVFQQSLAGASLTQGEYDTYMDWVYQFGTGAWATSSMRRLILAGEYRKACDALLKYRYSGGYDCSVPGNKVCAGVWTRQLRRHQKCIDSQ